MIGESVQGGPGGAAVPLEAEAGEETDAVEAILERLVSAVVRWHNEHPREQTISRATGVTEGDDAGAVIRRACIASALTGATIGAVSTAASVITAQTEGLAAFIAVPATALSIGGEAVLRFVTHVHMICEIGDLFDLRFDPEDPDDIWALFTLAFGKEAHAADVRDPGKRLLRLARADSEDVIQSLSGRLLGESVLKNIIPFFAVASSSVTNWIITRRLGDTVRRYMRYRRALGGPMCDERLRPYMRQLILGVWFLFTADGHLRPEESALLAALLRRLPSPRDAALTEALADDIAWIEGLPAIAEEAREPFFHALVIAAAVDKFASLREQKLLSHAASALGLDFDASELSRMIREFEEIGVLAAPPRTGERTASSLEGLGSPA